MSNFNLKVAIYPGSFNPFHEGHMDVVQRALQIFDTVIIAKGVNPEKEAPSDKFHATSGCSDILQELIDNDRVELDIFDGLLVDYIETAGDTHVCDLAIVKGLRHGYDLEDEKQQLYWNEDLGLTIPSFYVITDRKYSHISSSAIRYIRVIKERNENATDDDS